jgi:hypothetical protein
MYNDENAKIGKFSGATEENATQLDSAPVLEVAEQRDGETV